MRNFISMLAMGLLAGFVAGCTTTIDQSIQKSLPRICEDAATAHIAFVAVASTGRIKQSTIDKEVKAFAALQPLCDNPKDQTAATVLIQALTLYVTISQSLAEAQKVN